MTRELNDSGGCELSGKNSGLREVPVFAKGGKYVFGQDLDVVGDTATSEPDANVFSCIQFEFSVADWILPTSIVS